MLCCNTYQFLCLCCIQGKCLFTQNRLSCFQAHLHVLIMLGMRSCHVNKIYLFICHQIGIGSISLLTAIFPCKNVCMNLLPGRHCINPDIFHFIYRSCHDSCDITASHNSNIKISKHFCSSFAAGYFIPMSSITVQSLHSYTVSILYQISSEKNSPYQCQSVKTVCSCCYSFLLSDTFIRSRLHFGTVTQDIRF